jgi:hypothetical protein
MNRLNHQERTIIEWVSFEGLTLREVSARWQVSYVQRPESLLPLVSKTEEDCRPEIGWVAAADQSYTFMPRLNFRQSSIGFRFVKTDPGK